jgi:SAM-dependent methyltransferase
LLDIGGHVGKFIAMAAQAGWVAEAIEANPTTAAYARERTGLAVHQSALADLAPAGRRFDAVTLIDVLEHMPRPVTVLRAAAAVLAPGGWISVKVPCGPNQLLKEKLRVRLGRAARVSVADNLVHVSHFSPRSLQLALESAGFAEVTLTVGRPERSVAASSRVRTISNAGRSVFLTAARLWPGGVRSPLAFNLQAYARLTERGA